MLRALLLPAPLPHPPGRLTLSHELRRALLISQGLAVLWWLIAFWFRSLPGFIPVWADQEATFTQTLGYLHNPFDLYRFLYPPWTAFLLAPFSLTPLPLAALIQTCLLFGVLTLVIFRFGGSLTACLVMLTSFVAMMATIEINIEWLVYIGLLAPPAISGIFLLIKPQNALGVWLSYPRPMLIRALLVAAALTLLSFIPYGFWPESILARGQVLSLYQIFNMAPSALLGLPLALLIGVGLAIWAFRRRDPILSILAWLFFVPYIAPYSLLLHLGLLAIRWPRLMLLVSAVIWVVYGGVVGWGILNYFRAG